MGNRSYQLISAGQSANHGQICGHWLAGNSYFPCGRIFISCFSELLGINIDEQSFAWDPTFSLNLIWRAALHSHHGAGQAPLIYSASVKAEFEPLPAHSEASIFWHKFVSYFNNKSRQSSNSFLKSFSLVAVFRCQAKPIVFLGTAFLPFVNFLTSSLSFKEETIQFVEWLMKHSSFSSFLDEKSFCKMIFFPQGRTQTSDRNKLNSLKWSVIKL